MPPFVGNLEPKRVPLFFRKTFLRLEVQRVLRGDRTVLEKGKDIFHLLLPGKSLYVRHKLIFWNTK